MDEQGGVTEHSELVLWFAPDSGKRLMWLSAKRVYNPAENVDVWVISVNVTWLRAGRPGILISPAGKRHIYLSPNIHNDSGDHKFFYATGTGGCSSEVKQSVCEVDNLHLMPRLGRNGDTPPLSLHVFTAWIIIWPLSFIILQWVSSEDSLRICSNDSLC